MKHVGLRQNSYVILEILIKYVCARSQCLVKTIKNAQAEAVKNAEAERQRREDVAAVTRGLADKATIEQLSVIYWTAGEG